MSTQAPFTSRYEINRFVTSVLNRHAVDLSLLNVSSSTSIVYINGVLMKIAGADFRPTEVSAIFTEIRRIPRVRGIIADLENWVISNAEGSWSAAPAKSGGQARGKADGGSAGGFREYRVETEERVEDVLRDIRKTETGEQGPGESTQGQPPMHSGKSSDSGAPPAG